MRLIVLVFGGIGAGFITLVQYIASAFILFIGFCIFLWYAGTCAYYGEKVFRGYY